MGLPREDLFRWTGSFAIMNTLIRTTNETKNSQMTASVCLLIFLRYLPGTACSTWAEEGNTQWKFDDCPCTERGIGCDADCTIDSGCMGIARAKYDIAVGADGGVCAVGWNGIRIDVVGYPWKYLKIEIKKRKTTHLWQTSTLNIPVNRDEYSYWGGWANFISRL